MKHMMAEDEIREQAALYALGALDQEEARAFEEHLTEGCEVCHSELGPFAAVVLSLALAPLEQEPSPAVREKLLARLTVESQDAGAVTASRQASGLQFLTVRAGEGEWQELFEGVLAKQLLVDRAKGTVTSLYKLLPGAHVPMHTHAGVEQCLVIEGDFHVNDEVLGPGDFTCAMTGSIHETSFTRGGTTLLIVAQQGYKMAQH